MSLNRWKVLACTLTIGVGGLAVFATPPMGEKKEAPKEAAKEPALLPDLAVKPVAPANGDDTPAPVKPVKAETFDLQIPDVPSPKKSEEPVFEPISPVPPLNVPMALPALKSESDEPKKAETKEPPMLFPPVPELPAGKLKELASPPAPASDGEKGKFSGNVLGLQAPGVPTPDLDVPIRASGSGRAVPPVQVPDSSKATDKATTPDLDAPIRATSFGRGDDLPGTPMPPLKAPDKISPPPAPSSPKPDPVKVPEIDFGPIPVAPSKAEPVAPLPSVPSVTPEPAPSIGIPSVGATKPPTPPEAIKVPLNPPPSLTPSPPPSAAKATETARLKMLLRMGDGQPRFEIRNSASTELLLKVYGEKIEMQAPPESKSSLAGVSAVGHVKFTAPGIEGTCDQLTILSATGEVLMKGNIHLKTKKGKTVNEMTAEKMVYQIGTAGLSSGESRPAVRPASYIPD